MVADVGVHMGVAEDEVQGGSPRKHLFLIDCHQRDLAVLLRAYD